MIQPRFVFSACRPRRQLAHIHIHFISQIHSMENQNPTTEVVLQQQAVDPKLQAIIDSSFAVYQRPLTDEDETISEVLGYFRDWKAPGVTGYMLDRVDPDSDEPKRRVYMLLRPNGTSCTFVLSEMLTLMWDSEELSEGMLFACRVVRRTRRDDETIQWLALEAPPERAKDVNAIQEQAFVSNKDMRETVRAKRKSRLSRLGGNQSLEKNADAAEDGKS